MRTTNNHWCAVCLGSVFLFLSGPAPARDDLRAIKVVIVAMYEIGAASGDNPGELQLWVERLDLDTQLAFPSGESDLYLNDEGVLAFVTGGGQQLHNATARQDRGVE